MISVEVTRSLAATGSIWDYRMPGIEKVILQHAFEFLKEKLINEGSISEREGFSLTRELIEQHPFEPDRIPDVNEFEVTIDLDEERRENREYGFRAE